MPRPMRLCSRTEPGAGLSSERFIPSSTANFHQMLQPANHALNRRTTLELALASHLAKAESFHRLAHAAVGTDRTSYQFNPNCIAHDDFSAPQAASVPSVAGRDRS